jgi:glycosyltransferase involved in cell wall biosynthesis
MPLVMLDYDHNELVKIATELNDPDLVNHIILTGYVSNTELPAIYSQALIMLYPSLRESFGIPVLEAMACGVPVITSNTSSLPEVADDAAVLVDPNKPEEIAGAISRLIEDSALCNELVEKGYRQSAKFSWKAMAIKVLEIYKEVVADKRK